MKIEGLNILKIFNWMEAKGHLVNYQDFLNNKPIQLYLLQFFLIFWQYGYTMGDKSTYLILSTQSLN